MVEKKLRVGEEDAVPGIAAPTKIMAGLVGIRFAHGQELFAIEVPIHVNHQHIERHSVLAEALDDVVEFLIAVSPIARPPRAKGEARRQRDASRNQDVVAQGLLVVVAVAEEIPVLPLARRAWHDPWPRAVFALREAEIGGVKEWPL